MNSPDTRPVVVGVDGGPGSAGALRYAVAEATRRGAPLRVVHVIASTPAAWPGVPMGVTMSELHEVATGILAAAVETARGLAPDLETTTRLAAGGRAAALVDAAEDAQLLVVGRETAHVIDRILVGAVTAAVASRAVCDVVVVPSFWTADHQRGRVVAAVKSRTNAHRILGEAFAQARARGAELTIATAWELPDPYLDRIEVRTHADEWEQDGRRMLDDVLAPWLTEYPDVPVGIRVEHGRAAEVLLAVSRDGDLLLLSRRRHIMPPHGHLGGVASAVLRLSDVPVLVVPFAGAEAEPVDRALVLEESGAPVK